MGWADYLPEVKKPTEKKLSLKNRFIWTGVVLFFFFALGRIPLFGLGPNMLSRFKTLSLLLGANFGSLTTLGIGPIVTASIILQLLVGAKLIRVDTSSVEGRKKFEGYQRISSYAFIILEAFAYVYLGAFRPSSNLPVSTYHFYQLLLVLQLMIGGFFIMLMDDLSTKWGIGSGISLFIAAGVSFRLFVRLFSMQAMSGSNVPAGIIPLLVVSFSKSQYVQDALIGTISLLSTLFIFFFVVYVQSMRVEVPLVYSTVRGYSFKWPINFLYTSNMPVILAASTFANIQVLARMLQAKGITWLGTFDANGNAISGMVKYMIPSRSLLQNLMTGSFVPSQLFTALVYLSLMVGLSVLFGILWVQISGMDAKSLAKNIHQSDLRRPGFRSDKRMTERLLKRYIPYVAFWGSLTVGLLAGLADILGALVSGTGLLLTVMIVYQFYENIARDYAEEMPMVRKLFK